MIFAAGLALAIILVALLRRGVSNEEIVSRIRRERDPRVVETAAKVLADRGMSQTAKVLLLRARNLSQTSTSAVTGSMGDRAQRSPLPRVADDAWMAFVDAIAASTRSMRSPDGRIGKFGISLHRLADIDWVTSVRADASGRVDADWVPPLTEARFLMAPSVQYRALTGTVRALMQQLSKLQLLRPASVDGQRVSLSGLLAVAHVLGAARVRVWLTSRSERTRQGDATALFQQCNGLF